MWPGSGVSRRGGPTSGRCSAGAVPILDRWRGLRDRELLRRPDGDLLLADPLPSRREDLVYPALAGCDARIDPADALLEAPDALGVLAVGGFAQREQHSIPF